jgi:hypothetical protein
MLTNVQSKDNAASEGVRRPKGLLATVGQDPDSRVGGGVRPAKLGCVRPMSPCTNSFTYVPASVSRSNRKKRALIRCRRQHTSAYEKTHAAFRGASTTVSKAASKAASKHTSRFTVRSVSEALRKRPKAASKAASKASSKAHTPQALGE